MGRPLRFVPAGSVVEVTSRTVGARFLLRPGPAANALILGVLGRAQHLFGVRVFAVAVMSNHLHALLGVDDGAQLASFMQHALGNIAKEIGFHHRWQGPFWSRRYRSIVVADEESQVARLRYVLCQGVKEGLVARVDRWPGVSTFGALAHGRRLYGVWRHRIASSEAPPNESRVDAKIESEYELKVSRLPALDHHSPEEHQAYIRAIVRAEEDAARAERTRPGNEAAPFLGARRVLAQDPHAAPLEPKTSPAPMVHAASPSMCALFKAKYRAFVDAFRTAASCLRAGAVAHFPEGAFPPPAPFVRPPPKSD